MKNRNQQFVELAPDDVFERIERMKQRIAIKQIELRERQKPRVLGNGLIVRSQYKTHAIAQRAIYVVPSPNATTTTLLDRFYKINRNLLPQVQKTIRQRPLVGDSFHVFIFYQGFYVTMAKDGTLSLYYSRRTQTKNENYLVAAYYVPLPDNTFHRKPDCLKLVTRSILLRKFKAVHSDTLIPL